MDRKEFDLWKVLSVTTGCPLGPIDGMYEILSWMTDGPVYLHQIPRLNREAAPVILAAHPDLCAAVSEAEQVTPENSQAWLDAWVGRFGSTRAVPRLSADQHKSIGPITELVVLIGRREDAR